MAMLASRLNEVETQVNESLQPQLHRLVEVVTAFFGR
jgi:hypothetical protein